jgi:hypothetical protein
MSRYTYVKDLPESVTIVHHDAWPSPAPPGETGLIELDLEVLDGMAHYDTSVPTGPSPGRIYAVTPWRWVDGRRVFDRDGRWVMICERDPENDDGVYHHPHTVLLVAGAG